MDVTRDLFWVEGLLALMVIGSTARWVFFKYFRGSPVTCPQCQRETRWLGNLPSSELHGYCLYCLHCGIMISVLETEHGPDDERSLRSPFDALPAYRRFSRVPYQPPNMIENWVLCRINRVRSRFRGTAKT